MQLTNDCLYLYQYIMIEETHMVSLPMMTEKFCALTMFVVILLSLQPQTAADNSCTSFTFNVPGMNHDFKTIYISSTHADV